MYIAKWCSIVHEMSGFYCNQDQTIFKNSGNVEAAAEIIEYLLNTYWMSDASIELFIGPMGKMGIGADVGVLWWGSGDIDWFVANTELWAFGRMYVVALLYHRMCLEQFEDIYLTTSGSLDGYLWSLANIWRCIECAPAHANVIQIWYGLLWCCKKLFKHVPSWRRHLSIRQQFISDRFMPYLAYR